MRENNNPRLEKYCTTGKKKESAEKTWYTVDYIKMALFKLSDGWP